MKSISTKLWIVLLLMACHTKGFSQTNHVVISQLFGSGGVSATLPSNDFIELYNPTGAAVNLNGWSVQFAFGNATTYTRISLSGFILAKSYYLIQLGRDNYYPGTPMPTPDLTYNYNINSPDMKVGLYNFTAAVTGGNPSATAVDFVGTGSATGYENTASPQGSYNVSLMRKASASSTTSSMSSTGAEYKSGNGYDTNNNSVDLLLTSNVVARSANSNPLAINFVSFDLVKTTGGNQLRWQVASSHEANSFEVERSIDGVSFSRIGQVQAQAGTSYLFVDGFTTAAYYRIKAVAYEGAPQFSTTVFAGAKNNSGVKVYPTLATSNLIIQLPAGAKEGWLAVYAANGTLQQQTTTDRQAQVTLSIASLKPGTYLLQYVSASGEATTERFVKAG